MNKPKDHSLIQYYLAGGAVRDMLLGRIPKDRDFAFKASAESFIKANPAARKLGMGPAYGLNGHEFTPLEGKSELDDIFRRDFTINALLLSENGMLRMHPRAMDDLREKLISPCTLHSLADDPCRVFRAARLHAELPDFTLSDACLAAMQAAALTPEFAAIAPERIGRETVKACRGARPGHFLRVLSGTSALFPWFQELHGANDIPAGPPQFHDNSVLEHTAQVMNRAACLSRQYVMHKQPAAHSACNKNEPNADFVLESVWMALCHDLGKITTDPAILPHHYGHELRGIAAAQALGVRLRLPTRLITGGMLAAQLHMKAGIYPRLRPGTKVDLLAHAAAKGMLVPLGLCAEADAKHSGILQVMQRDWDVISLVELPEVWRDKGKTSGDKLRELRCAAVAAMWSSRIT